MGCPADTITSPTISFFRGSIRASQGLLQEPHRPPCQLLGQRPNFSIAVAVFAAFTWHFYMLIVPLKALCGSSPGHLKDHLFPLYPPDPPEQGGRGSPLLRRSTWRDPEDPGLLGGGSLPVEHHPCGDKIGPTLTLFKKALKVRFCQHVRGPQGVMQPLLCRALSALSSRLESPPEELILPHCKATSRILRV